MVTFLALEVFDRGILSRLFYLLLRNYFSRSITSLVENGSLIPMTSSRNEKAPVYFLFADDVLLFARTSKTNIKAIFNALRKYKGLFGQQVNFSKSIFFGSAVSLVRISGFLAQTSMKKGNSPSFQPILDKIHVNFIY
ncbi:hypothetical protein PanWU01x14_259230 [Parasponia andersonii]|uniref:Reverse transcriptase domain-containing protein n=1 Tax=Parasponia andersonii TaxID=3476 RepID=A0A2P5B9I4_PARAD|nr:hypothetical protein PanWU01x14_259230 [Parasponia andersonii]